MNFPNQQKLDHGKSQKKKKKTGNDGRDPRTSPSASPTKRRSRPTTRAMIKKNQEDWNTATDGRETFLYMFKMP